MGNANSSRWPPGYRRKALVESHLNLDAAAVLPSADAIRAGVAWSLGETWRAASGAELAAAQISMVYTANDAPLLCVKISMRGVETKAQYLAVEFTDTPWGARRPWLVCPCCRGRRRVLYAPVSGFPQCLCRDCHGLAYASAGNSHERWLYRHIPGYRLARRADRLAARIAGRDYLTPKTLRLVAAYRELVTRAESEAWGEGV